MTLQPITDDVFWASIEAAWATVDHNGARSRLLSPDPEIRFRAVSDLDPHFDAFFAVLRSILDSYTSEQLCEWDARCERALYDLDRQDVHAALDGSDDGFLYARGFVVAAGKEHYDAVNNNPEGCGIMDAEAERMCYFAAHLHNDKFGTWPPRTGISRESCSNPAWKDW